MRVARARVWGGGGGGGAYRLVPKSPSFFSALGARQLRRHTACPLSLSVACSRARSLSLSPSCACLVVYTYPVARTGAELQRCLLLRGGAGRRRLLSGGRGCGGAEAGYGLLRVGGILDGLVQLELGRAALDSRRPTIGSTSFEDLERGTFASEELELLPTEMMKGFSVEKELIAETRADNES